VSSAPSASTSTFRTGWASANRCPAASARSSGRKRGTRSEGAAMLIEDLIRLGRPVLESGLEPREVLRLITDAAGDRVKNFYRHVIVVELPPEGTDLDPAVLPVQNWQTEQQVVGKKKPEIDVDVERALGTPFTIPSGGNVEHAQGWYGLPVYPVWDLH